MTLSWRPGPVEKWIKLWLPAFGTLAKEGHRAVFKGGCRDGNDGVLVVVAHVGGFKFPVLFTVLDDTEAIDPDMADFQAYAYLNGVAEHGR